MSAPRPPFDSADARSPYARGLLLSTIGSFSLIFLAAFESLAVATVMPVISEDLDGSTLYALAMGAPLATGVLGMVGAGGWADRRGPKAPFWLAVVLFTVGLIVCGVATDMITFTVGRVIQGFGGGAMHVTLYVLVARLYPPHLHAAMFGLFAAGWVLPSLVGPFAAGLVADLFSWHWVFLGVVALVALAVAVMFPSLSAVEGPAGDEEVEAWRPLVRQLGLAAVVVVAILALGTLGRVPGYGPLIIVALAALTLVAMRPLLPVGAFRLAPGLPAAVVLRGFLAAAFFGAETFLPLVLREVYGLPPTQAGLALTAAALTWAAASWAQGRFLLAVGDRRLLLLSTLTVLACIVGVTLAVAVHAPVWLIVACWGLGGFGMGLAYPRLSTMVIQLSTRRNQGFNAAALNIADSGGAALGLAALGVLVSGPDVATLVLVFGLCAGLAALGSGVALRTQAPAGEANAAA